MSTTLPTTPMHPASFAPARSALAHLCWKELRQVIPAHLVIVGLAVVVIFAVQFYPDMAFFLAVGAESPILLWNTINVLSAVVCASVFYGMDRENGSWAWQSSLPVSWQLSAGSRLLTAGATFLVVALGGWLFIGNILFEPTVKYEFGTSMLLGGMFWFQTYCVFAIALMLVGDILWGLVLAASLVIAVQAILPLPTSESGADLLAFAGSDLVFWRVGILMAVQFLFLAMVLSAHAWRWNHGCYSDVAYGLRKRFQLAAFLPTISIGAMDVTSHKTQPGNIRSLLWLSARQYFFARLSIAMASIWILISLVLDEGQSTLDKGWIQAFAIGSLVFLGVSVFGGDQPRKRFAAVSSRGVSPELFWFLKILVPLLVAILVGAAFTLPVFRGSRENFGFVALGFVLMLFVAAQLCGLCFRSTVTAVIVTVIAGWLFAVAIYMGFWAMPIEMGMEPLTPFWMLALGAFGLVLASLWCCRRWFILDTPRLVVPFIWIASVYLVLAFLMGAGTKYLAIPNVAWKGGAPDSVPACIGRLTLSALNGPDMDTPLGGIPVERWRDETTGRVINEVPVFRLRPDTSELIAQHFQWNAKQRWLEDPVRFGNQLRYPHVVEPKPLTNEELESVASDIRNCLDKSEKSGPEDYGQFARPAFGYRHVDGEWMNAAMFCLDQKLWPEAKTLLTDMGRIRTNPLVRAQLGQKLGTWNPYVDISTYFGPEQIAALGGPGVVRDLLRPLYFSSDEASTFVSDILTTLRFESMDSPAMVKKLGGKGVRGYLGFGRSAGSVSNWLLPHLNARLAAAHLEAHVVSIRNIREQASLVRSQQMAPAVIGEMSNTYPNNYWVDIPYTDNSSMANILCASATSMAARWELTISPLLDEMDQDQKKRASGQESGEQN